MWNAYIIMAAYTPPPKYFKTSADKRLSTELDVFISSLVYFSYNKDYFS